MTTRISSASTNWTTASTWKAVSAVAAAEVDSEAGTLILTNTNSDSSTFVLAATNVDAVAIKISSVITPTGTLSVILRNSTTSTDAKTVTINCSDLRADAQGWHVFSFSALTPNGTNSFLVRLVRSVADSASNRITVYATASTAATMCRAVRLVTTGVPASDDKLIIAGEFTGAGTSNSYTVTMDALESTYINRSAQFIANNTENFTIPSNATLQTGDIDFWVSGWILLDTLGANRVIFERTGSSAAEYVWRITTGNVLYFAVTTNPQVELGRATSTFGALTTGIWYFVIAYHDSVNNLVKISVNGGAFDSTATTGAPTASTGVLTVGNQGQGSIPYNGRMNCLAFGKNPVGGIAALANAIRDSLYNAGTRKYYADLTGTEKTNWGLVSFWNLNEVSNGSIAVTRNDSHGTNHLTDINTVMSIETANVLSYGPTVTGGPPQGITINDKGTLTFGTTAATNYYLKWKGVLKVFAGGTLNVGTSVTPIPSNSNAVLDMDSITNVDTGIEANPGSTINMYGAAKYPTNTITGVSNTTPIEITSAGHGLVAGERIAIQGVVGGAAQFIASKSQWLTMSAPVVSSLATGNVSFWAAAWVYIDNKTPLPSIFQKGSSGAYEFTMYYALPQDRFRLVVYTPAGSALGNIYSTFGPISTGTWYFVIAYQDIVNNLVGISVNGGAFDTAATGGGIPTAGTGSWFIGSGNTGAWDGRISSACFGKSPPGGIAAIANAIRDSLYNSGSGKFYSNLTGTEKTDWGLVSYWQLGDPYGMRLDSHSLNHLSDNNLVLPTAGVASSSYIVNGNWEVIASTGANTFTIGYINGGTAGTVGTSTGSGTYISGGTWARIGYTRMTADKAVAATVINLQSTQGMAAGDVLLFTPTTNVRLQNDIMTILTVDSPTQVTLTAGLTFAHSGTFPIQCEVGNLTRNIKIRGSSPGLQGYVFFQTTSICTYSNVEFYQLGSATGNKRGLEFTTSTGSALVNYCSIHDFWITGVSSCAFCFASGTNSNITGSNCVIYNTYFGIYISLANNGTWVLSGNLVVRTDGTHLVSISDVGGVFIDNVLVGGAGSGLAISEAASLGTFRGNTLHTNAANGIGIANQIGGTISNTNIWRSVNAGGAGLVITGPNASNLIIDNMLLFGNNTHQIIITGGANFIFKNVTCASDTTTAAAGVRLAGTISAVDFYFENCTFGVASGILALNTTDFTWDANIYGTITCRNCLFASTTEFTGQATIAPGSYLASQKHDQVVGAHKTWYRTGTISTDTTIYDVSPSERLTPNSLSEKLESGNEIKVFVDNGATATVTAKVRESVVGDGTDYNGARARLICKKNVAAGIPADVVIATATSASEGSWETLSGVTPVVADNAVLTICIDVDGSTGWVSVDTIAAA